MEITLSPCTAWPSIGQCSQTCMFIFNCRMMLLTSLKVTSLLRPTFLDLVFTWFWIFKLWHINISTEACHPSQIVCMSSMNKRSNNTCSRKDNKKVGLDVDNSLLFCIWECHESMLYRIQCSWCAGTHVPFLLQGVSTLTGN